jgi:hypothetical protein
LVTLPPGRREREPVEPVNLRDRAADLDRPAFWTVSRGGIVLAPGAMVSVGDALYDVRVWSLCASERADMQIACTQAMPVAEFARRARVICSIMHWRQNGCLECERRLRLLPSRELEWVTLSDPSLGAALGFDLVRKQI